MSRNLVNRHFTEEGVHPYDELDWSTRVSKIINEKGNTVFEQEGVIVPKNWSQMATNVVASKYFRGHIGEDTREYTVGDLIDRVVDTITEWGFKDGYFLDPKEGDIFNRELKSILVNQRACFNSPVWFNVGVHDKPQCSACFILSVDDNMESILDWYKKEGMIFKGGSGAGLNISNIRSKGEKLTVGGTSSGPVSFMRAADASAGVIKSGGACLAPYQMVYTESGPIEVQELAKKESFLTLSYDPPARRFKVKEASAWLAGVKKVVRVITDKGEFDLSEDHPVRLSTGESIQAGNLTPGISLMKCSVQEYRGGYLRVGLQDGMKTKEVIHRLVAKDILGEDLEGVIVHHKNGDKGHNRPENLNIMTQSDHALHHTNELVSKGNHIFQKEGFSHSGELNGMHKSQGFWKDETKVKEFKNKQSEIFMGRGEAREMQKVSGNFKMINVAHRVLNAGFSIDTFEGYIKGRKSVLGPIPSITKVKESIQNRFGSYEGFLKEVNGSNHRVIDIQIIGEMPVYDVEVKCPTQDDKSPTSGHNFVIWPDSNKGGSGIVVFNTRRSAKMVIMNVDHPDIMEFINCKADEEKKAWALIGAGYNPSIDGEAYRSVYFQNANNSVRVNDKFMRAVINEDTWNTREVTTGKISESLRARDIFRYIAEAAHFCGDPGVQFDTIINDWHTCPNTGRINGSNPCSEYLHLDNSACNLASINLLKFLKEDNTFDVKGFKHTVDVMITAQDILVGNSSYPTEEITQNAKDYRELGLGYANLGALLMCLGLPYDSDDGRSYAAMITSLMSGEGYLQSARIAEILGYFKGYEKNKQPMLDVLVKHGDAARGKILYNGEKSISMSLVEESKDVWSDVYDLATSFGVRNSQISVLAPTGTIAFMMDCDTTGVEPDIALVKYKKLVGGGVLKMVNNSVHRALKFLGYTDYDIKGILGYINDRGTIEGAEDLQEVHLPIFDCAFKAENGIRSISSLGHIKMMGAVQPFISGAISKTVNLPETATVEDVETAYRQAWKNGVKAIAIYRDGSKRTQPLNTSESKEGAVKESVVVRATNRHKLPDERPSITHKFDIAGHEGYLTVGLYDNGQPGELFVTMSKEGSTISGLMDSFATAISMSFQYGVPLKVLVDKFSHARFEPSGFTRNPDIPMAKSIIDYIFRWLATKFYDDESKEDVGIIVRKENGEVEDDMNAGKSYQTDAPSCSDCGSITVRNGSCYKCLNCGSSSGCS